jgi:ketosteroid isomerase-like protein
MRVSERFECFNRGEMDLMIEPYADDAVFDISAVFTDVGPARGRDEMVRLWRELQHTWGGGLRLDPLEVLDLGDGHLVLEVRLWGKSTHQGAEVDQRFGLLYDFRGDGKIARAQLFSDGGAAIAAASS